MKNEEVIRVFISSKCGGERINFERLVDDSSTTKEELAQKAIRTSYDIVRKALKLSLEETGFIKVYLFEEESASTSSAKEDYLFKIDESHICLFLIDNFDENISEGLLQEINRAKSLNKKSIYIFLNQPDRKKTNLQENINGANGSHYYVVEDTREFITKGYHSVVDDIIKVYQKYSKGYMTAVSETQSSIEITKDSFQTETTDIKKQIFENLGLTKNKIIGLVYETEKKENKSSEMDNLCLVVLEVILGEKRFDEINLSKLLEKLSELQSPELYKVVKERWKAISNLYNGNIDNALSILESLYTNFSDDRNIPKWLINNILIDCRNINIIKDQMSNVIYDSSSQKKIDQQDSPIFFPLIDRFSNNLNDEILKRNFNSSTDSPYTYSIYNEEFFFSYIPDYLFVAIYYGSYTNLVLTLEQIRKVLFDIVQNDNNLLYKIQLMRISILLGNEHDFLRIMNKYKSSLSHSTAKEIMDLYRLAETKPLPYEISKWKILLFMELGYYFSDNDYENVSNEIIKYSCDLLSNIDLNIGLVEKLIKAIELNIVRLPKEKIIIFTMEILHKKYYHFFDSVFKLLGEIDFREESREIISSLISQISTILENEEIARNYQNLDRLFTRLRKNRDDFSVEIDEMVEKYYPDFFKNDYHLEIYPDERSKHINRYLDVIKYRNKTQGENGRYTFYGDNPYPTIKNILELGNIIISEELLTNLLNEIANTLFSETQTYSEKINSIQLLLFLKRQGTYRGHDWNNFYLNLLQNISKVEKGGPDFFEQNKSRLLGLNLLLLRMSFGENCFQEILEILAQINNSDDGEIINSLVYLHDFLKNKRSNFSKNPILSIVIQYVSNICLHENNVIRYNTVKVFYQLINTKYSNFAINRLVKMIDDNDFTVKWAIVNQVPLIKQLDVTSYNYILGKARIDNNYIVRKRANNIVEN